jgi:general secretion pathway protein M
VTDQKNTYRNKALAIAILCGMVVLVIGLLAFPIWSINKHYSEKIVVLETRLQILSHDIQSGEKLEAEYQRLLSGNSTDKRYLKSQSDALAAAELQRIVKISIVPAGGEILSTQIVPNTQKEGTQKVSLKVRMKAELKALVKVFYQLETGYPLLFIDSFTIRSRSVGARRVINRNPTAQLAARMLDVDFQVSGYILSEKNEN